MGGAPAGRQAGRGASGFVREPKRRIRAGGPGAGRPRRRQRPGRPPREASRYGAERRTGGGRLVSERRGALDLGPHMGRIHVGAHAAGKAPTRPGRSSGGLPRRSRNFRGFVRSQTRRGSQGPPGSGEPRAGIRRNVRKGGALHGAFRPHAGGHRSPQHRGGHGRKNMRNSKQSRYESPWSQSYALV